MTDNDVQKLKQMYGCSGNYKVLFVNLRINLGHKAKYKVRKMKIHKVLLKLVWKLYHFYSLLDGIIFKVKPNKQIGIWNFSSIRIKYITFYTLP